MPAERSPCRTGHLCLSGLFPADGISTSKTHLQTIRAAAGVGVLLLLAGTTPFVGPFAVYSHVVQAASAVKQAMFMQACGTVRKT